MAATVKVQVKLADGVERQGEYTTCIGVLNLMERAGVDFSKVKGTDVKFVGRDGITLATSENATYLLTSKTGRPFARRMAAQLAAAAKAKAPAKRASRKAPAKKTA